MRVVYKQASYFKLKFGLDEYTLECWYKNGLIKACDYHKEETKYKVGDVIHEIVEHWGYDALPIEYVIENMYIE